MQCVYIFQNKQNNKVYVGKTNNFRKRMRDHKSSSLSKSPKYYFGKALKKYGFDSFKIHMLEKYDNEKDCLDAEMFWICFFRSNVPDYGYNLTVGGEGVIGYVYTDDDRKRISLRNMGSGNGHFGRKHSEESKRLMSNKKILIRDNLIVSNSGESNPGSKIREDEMKHFLDLWFDQPQSKREEYGFKKIFWTQHIQPRHSHFSYKHFVLVLQGKRWKHLVSNYIGIQSANSPSSS